MSGGGLAIYQPLDYTNLFIGTVTGRHEIYAGFISATVTSIAPGTLFHAQPDLGLGHGRSPELQSDESEEDWLIPSTTVCTQSGDVICKFKISSIDRDITRPDVYVHLMRLMPPSDVAILKQRRLMISSPPPLGQMLDERAFKMHQALDLRRE